MSIACRTGIALLQLVPRNTPVTADFGNEIWDAFQKAEVQFELIATSRKELSVVVDAASLTPEFLKQPPCPRGGRGAGRPRAGHPGRAKMLPGIPRTWPGLRNNSARLPGGAILGWCSDSRFAFVLAADALNTAAEALHNEFFGQPDPAFFVPNRASVMVAVPGLTGTRLTCPR